jgi:hypothetical protein
MKKFVVLIVVFLSGCTTTPKSDYERDWHSNPVRVKTNNVERNDLLSYLVAQMLDFENRKQLIARLNKQYVADSDLKAGAINGALFSNSGDVTGVKLAVFQAATGLAISLFSPGSMKEVSGIALPDKIGNKTIETQDEAWAYATSLAVNQLEKVSKKFNFKLSCVMGCSDERRIYSLTPNDTNVFDGYIYKPTSAIYVVTTWPKLVKVEKPDPLAEKLRGFSAAWETPKGNMWLTRFFTDPVLDDNGKVQINTNEEGLIYPVVKKALVDTHLGRDLHRAYYDDGGYMYFGIDSIYPNYIAFNGTLYGHILSNDTKFIEYEIVEK